MVTRQLLLVIKVTVLDAQHPQIKDRIQQSSISVFRTRQDHATSVFNNAFVTTHPTTGASTAGPDTVALCSAVHPYSPSVSTTQGNLGTSALSVDALEATRIAMLNLVDDRGKKMLIMPDAIIVPPNLTMLAEEILKSAGRSDTADRVDNVRRGAYKIITLNFLTDTNNWFMVDTKLMKMFLKWFERRKPVPERNEDFDTETLKWKYVARYAYGFHGYHFCFGHNAA